jgi:hypothetical protein
MGLEQNYARNVSLTVGVTEVNISPKKERKSIYIRNTSTSAQIITLAFDNINAVTAGVGVVLAPGEYITESTTEGYNAWNGDIKAIANAAGGTVAIMEQPREEEKQ